jgi:predicted ribosome quality control (RQC) complex YloA/Tae2 family protein
MITESYMNGRDIYIIKIGQNKTDNWSLIDGANPDNIWFHVSGAPSSHIVLDTICNIKEIPSSVIYRCAVLCSKRSSSHKQRHSNINYTYVKHVLKGERIGEVIIKKAYVIRV